MNKNTVSRSRVRKSELYDYIDAVQLNRIDPENFEITLAGESKDYHAEDEDFPEPGVEYQMALRLIQNLRILSNKDKNRPILIHMKTCGGNWEEGMAIYNAIRFCPNKITILSYTHARSMSSLILQAADKRVLMPNSYFLFHEGTIGLVGTVKYFESYAEYHKMVIKPTMLNIYIEVLKRTGKHTRWSPERIKEMLQERIDKQQDVYLTEVEAVEWGFADEIFDGDYDALKTKYPRQRKKRS